MLEITEQIVLLSQVDKPNQSKMTSEASRELCISKSKGFMNLALLLKILKVLNGKSNVMGVATSNGKLKRQL